jgi:hypothetical protein
MISGIDRKGILMSSRIERSRQDGAADVGTLWTLEHEGHTARCALFAWKTTWEVRVLVDREVLLTQHCDRTDQTFSLAEQWKRRLLTDGWRQVVPPSPERAA